MSGYNFISLFGLFGLCLLAYCFSKARRQINWHVVIWGVGLQFLFAWFLFVFPAGVKFFMFLNDVVVKVMDSSMAGTKFLFGPLALAPGMVAQSGESSVGFILAFQALPTIIFFSSLMGILYYYNIIPKLIKAFAFLFTRLMKISGAESLCSASNIFVGVESVLTVKPYLKDMTKSELCTVLAAGMATVSSNILAVYVFSLRDVFPNIAGHLISASFLSAPAVLAASKMLLPEVDQPKTLGEHINPYVEKDGSLFEAIINGANAGVKLIVGIGALLIAVLGLVALLDQIIAFLGSFINGWFTLNFDWSLKGILGIIFYPFILLLGVPSADAGALAQLIGQRLIVTELTSYQDLSNMIAQGVITSPRSAVVATYALCGFAHVASLAIFIGGVSAIVPQKTAVLAEVGLRALAAATLACLMTACVAGIFFVDGSILLGY